MDDYSGLICVFNEERRIDALQKKADADKYFTDAWSSPDWEMMDREVCLLSFKHKEINYACLSRRGNYIATAKRRVKFSHFVNLDGLSIHKIRRRLPPELRDGFTDCISGNGGRLPIEIWNAVISIISRLRPSKSEVINRLLERIDSTENKYLGRASEIVALERDAVGVSLDIFDSTRNTRKNTLGNWHPQSPILPPFLVGVDEISLSEEQILAHDLNVFPQGERYAHLYGTQFQLKDRILNIIYANRTSLERNVGVDLIYYNHSFEAYTLVQYKRLRSEGARADALNDFIYRVGYGRNFFGQISRMREFRESHPDEWKEPMTWLDYRLNGDGFFFKFCDSIALKPLSSELTKGMYLPREYVESLINSDVTNGPRGGTVINYENVKRHLNTTDFTKLVRDGWIGTRGISNESLTELIKQELHAKRAVVYSHSHDKQEG